MSGVEGAEDLLVEARPDWPHVRVVAEVGDPRNSPERVTSEDADLALKTGGRLTVDRGKGVARFTVPRSLGKQELVHPYLAPVAAVLSHWNNRLAFHAGAFIADGGAWAVVGERQAGKSSLLAWLALHGHQVVADDVLVLSGRAAYAGPRSVDLRRETAEELGVGKALGVIGARSRWRLALPELGSADVPLRGWLFLAWGDHLELASLPVSARLPRLVRSLTLRTPPAQPASLLELAGLPAYEFRRPRDWKLLSETTERLLTAVS